MSTKPKYKWKLIFGNPDKDHSYWLDLHSSQISIKDESGDYPDETDDGVLWLDMTKPLYVQRYEDKTYVSIPLIDAEESEETSTITSVAKAFLLAERFKWKLVFENALSSDGQNPVEAIRHGSDLVIYFT